MPRHLDLDQHLTEVDRSPGTAAELAVHLDALARQIRNICCAAASLGLCLLDIKPSNFLYDARKQKLYVIDLDPTNVPYLDSELLAIVEEAPHSCRRAKGVLLYLMLLLMYTHLRHFAGSAERAKRALARRLHSALARSCVPWQALADMPLHSPLTSRLRDMAQGYFYKSFTKEAALRALLRSGQELSALDGCDAAVVVDGRDYDQGQRCAAWASSDLRSFQGRASPCEADGQAVHVAGANVTDGGGRSMLPPLGAVATLAPTEACPFRGSAAPHSAALSFPATSQDRSPKVAAWSASQHS